MTDDVTVRGAENFLALSKALKAAGEKKLRRELHAAMRTGVRKHMPKTADGLAGALPSGLQGRGKKVNQVVRVKTGRDPGVTVAVPYGRRRGVGGLGASNAQRLNSSGTFRRPVFPDPEKPRNEWRWSDQSVSAARGWFDKAWLDSAPEIRRALEAAMEAVAEQIVKEARRG